MRAVLATGCVLSLVGLLVAGTQTIDGINIDAGNWGVSAAAIQDTDTQFGDYPTNVSYPNGNELDQMFVDADSDNIYIGLAGNHGDDNSVIVFIDVDPNNGPGGVLDLVDDPMNPSCVQGQAPIVLAMLSGTTFDPGFAPDYGLSMSVGKFPGQSDSQLVFAADLQNLNNPSEVEVLGIGVVLDDGSGTGLLTGDQGVSIAMSYANQNGVVGWSDPDMDGFDITDPNKPATATAGIEISIPRSLIGVTGAQDIRVFALLTNNVQGTTGPINDPNDPNDDQKAGPCGRFGFASNQALPGLGGVGNLATFTPGGPFLIDFSGAQGPGTQYVTVSIPAP